MLRCTGKSTSGLFIVLTLFATACDRDPGSEDNGGPAAAPTFAEQLALLNCSSGQYAVWDGTDWMCADPVTDTTLSEPEVEDYVTNGPLDLDAGTTVGGQSISTGAHTVDTQLSEVEVDNFVANNGYLTSYTETDPTVGTLTADQWCATNGAGDALDCTQPPPVISEVDPLVNSLGLADLSACGDGQIAKLSGGVWGCAADATDLEVVERDDARLTYVPAVFDCAAGNWCTATGNWGPTALAAEAYYTYCTSDTNDCSANYVDLTLAGNTYRSVLFSHLDWNNTGLVSVYLSFDGGTSFTFHKAIDTYQPVSAASSADFLTKTRVVVSNLPLGPDVVVRLVASRGRMHQAGFGLSRMVHPEQVDNGFGRTMLVTGAASDSTCDVNAACGPTALSARQLTIVKTRDDTRLRVHYTDIMRSYGNDGAANRACRWILRFNGADCPSGEIHGDTYGAIGTDMHQPGAIQGICSGLAAGTYTVQVYVREVPGHQARCYTGWTGSTFSLEAEEVR